MKKLAFLSGMTLTTAAAAAEETAVHQPEFWMQVQEHVVNNDIPQLLGYASNPAYTRLICPKALAKVTFPSFNRLQRSATSFS